MNAYLISLTGQGDSEYKLVDEETWEWVVNPYDNCPQSVLERLWGDADVRSDYEDIEEYRAMIDDHSSSSASNDKALYCPVIVLDGKDGFFFSAHELIRFCRTHDIDIVLEWEGYIY